MQTVQWPEHLKKTRQRAGVWRVLEQAAQPLSAAEIFHALLLAGEEMNLSTIYRVLSAFEEAGAVEKSSILHEDQKRYRLRTAEHAHYAVCLGCHKQFPLKSCPFETVKVESTEEDFAVTDHKLELYGYCKRCQQNRKKD